MSYQSVGLIFIVLACRTVQSISTFIQPNLLAVLACTNWFSTYQAKCRYQTEIFMDKYSILHSPFVVCHLLFVSLHCAFGSLLWFASGTLLCITTLCLSLFCRFSQGYISLASSGSPITKRKWVWWRWGGKKLKRIKDVWDFVLCGFL